MSKSFNIFQQENVSSIYNLNGYCYNDRVKMKMESAMLWLIASENTCYIVTVHHHNVKPVSQILVCHIWMICICLQM